MKQAINRSTRMVSAVALAMAFLLVTVLTIGCTWTGCYTVGDVKWCKNTGSVERSGDSIALHHRTQRTEMVGTAVSANLDCEFELVFDRGLPDSSVGLEIWDPDEHSITFRGGHIKVVTAGEVEVEKAVTREKYVGKLIKVHLKANARRLSAAIDDVTLIDIPNTWSKRHKLQPRINVEGGDTITLYSSFCATR